jgi:transcriptional regulator with XRE-family HTH domain
MARRGEDPELRKVRLRFGEQVRAARKKAGLSQAQLAERIGRSQRYVSFIETGGRSLPIETMSMIMRELGFTVEVEIKIRPIRPASKG